MTESDMASTLCTNADSDLLNCLHAQVDRLRQNIDAGRPYVWELRLSLDEFCALESAIADSISSHSGDYHHLLCEDFAIIIVIYLAEWYKRFYKGADTMDDNKVLSLTTEELKKVYQLAKIDSDTFVYNASKNPDKTSYRWLESLQVLGGLAVQAELKRDKTDALLPLLCKIFHGEEIDLDDLKDRNRAVAFQESISRQHSLYDYLDCILDKDKEMPFAKSDMSDEGTMIPELIKRIESADALAKKNKFDFEWVIAYTASKNQMVRHLRVKLKPEIIGGGKKQYIGYDRLVKPQWGIEHPEEIGRIKFYLRFRNDGRYIKKEEKTDEPLFKYDNTGNEKTGFLSVNKIDENTYTDVPAGRFDKVEMVMKYDVTELDGSCRTVSKVVQELEVKDYMQVYALPKTSNRFSDHRSPQAATAVIFSSPYHLAEDYQGLPIVYAHFRNGEECGEDYCWCPVSDKVILAGPDGKEILPPFFNRNGLYQVVTKKYLKTIRYLDNVYVLYKYIDADYDDEVVQEDSISVLFGRSGLEVRHYATGLAKEGEAVTDYELEWLKNGKYVDWNREEPEQGAIRLRVTVKGMVFKLRVYYVPFEPVRADDVPIWRDFDRKRICTSLAGVDDIQDVFDMKSLERQPATKQLVIGDDNARILLEVYRPVILRELSQKQADGGSKIVCYCGKGEDIHIPLINCSRFSVRDFSENGVKEYQIQGDSTMYYNFPTFNTSNIAIDNYLLEKCALEMIPGTPLDYLKVYITKAIDNPTGLYAWNYKEEPVPVSNPQQFTEEGIVFQSLINNDNPRHCSMPKINKGKSGWGGKKSQLVVDPLYCYETAAKHKTYFFLFNPLIKVVQGMNQIKDIFIPLVKKRNYELTEEDTAVLYRFAVHFHFDWMLMPRNKWKEEVDAASDGDEVRLKLMNAIVDFFSKTPKSADERETECLKDFLKIYWTFNVYPHVDGVAEVALKLILDEPEALGKINGMNDFLKAYDGCRFKFIEMGKAIAGTDKK